MIDLDLSFYTTMANHRCKLHEQTGIAGLLHKPVGVLSLHYVLVSGISYILDDNNTKRFQAHINLFKKKYPLVRE